MSKVMKRSVPMARASSPAPTTPAAGPERIVRTGSSRASSTPMALPFDCITRSPLTFQPPLRGYLDAKTSAARHRRSPPWSRAARTRDTPARIRCEMETGRPSGLSAAAMASSLLGFAYECSRHTAKASALLARAICVMRASSLAVSGVAIVPSKQRALRDAEAHRARHQRFRPRRHQRIQLGTILPADLDEILEARVDEQRDARTLLLQQRVGCDRRTIGDARGLAPGENLCEAFDNRARRVIGRGKRFVDHEFAVD